MTKENGLKTINPFHKDFRIVKDLVFDKCGFALRKMKWNTESLEYGACSFELNGNAIEYRMSKITPTKTGQFVTIWKRGKNGETMPFDILDNLDFIIIASRSGDNFGQFIFPKAILADKGIISQNDKEGKRGIRVYPPWDIAPNEQAVKTKSWQTKYFLTIQPDSSADLDLVNKLFTEGDIR